MNKKLRGLLLQVEVMEGSKIEVLNENTFEVDGAEYLVLTEDEREEEFYNYQKSLIDDMGLNAFSEWAQDYIINNFADDERLEDNLFEIMYESYRNYIEDLKYENTLEDALKENDCEDEDEFLDLLSEEERKYDWDGCISHILQFLSGIMAKGEIGIIRNKVLLNRTLIFTKLYSLIELFIWYLSIYL